MPAVNPEILVWARETAGLTLQDAGAKIGLRDARGVGAMDRLTALERGEEEPTRTTLVKMAQHYRRPLLVFYLNAPPQRDESCPHFGTLQGTRSTRTDPLVDALVRNVQCRQEMVRAALEAEDEAEPLPFVGALLKIWDIGAGTESLQRVLQCESDSDRLSRHALNLLDQMLGDDLSARRYYEERSARDAFQLLRSRTEGTGVFVLLKGDLGSCHTAIDVEAFRGLVIADDVAPFVAINPNDSRSAHAFTLLHALTHLLLGQSGFGGADTESEVEEFCNDIAARWLLPAPTLEEIGITTRTGIVEAQQRIVEFSGKRNLSETMVAYRLLRTNRIDRPIFERLRAEFRQQWQEHHGRKHALASVSAGVPSHYAGHRYRVGQRLLGLTRHMLDSGALSTTKAARVLGVNPLQVGKILHSVQVQ